MGIALIYSYCFLCIPLLCRICLTGFDQVTRYHSMPRGSRCVRSLGAVDSMISFGDYRGHTAPAFVLETFPYLIVDGIRISERLLPAAHLVSIAQAPIR